MKNQFFLFLLLFVLLPLWAVAGHSQQCYDTFTSNGNTFERTYSLQGACFHHPGGEDDRLSPDFNDFKKRSSTSNQSSSFSIQQSDFETHLATGMTRIIQTIGDDETELMLMNVGTQGTGQVWNLPDFTTFNSYKSFQMSAMAPENTPYDDEDFPDATHAFTISGSGLYSYYRIGEVEFSGGNIQNVVYYYGDIDATNTDHAAIIQSAVPLTLNSDPFGGSTFYNCDDFDDEPCSDYPTAIYHEEKQTYFPQDIGMLNLFDDEPVEAMKLHILDEIIYYDANFEEVGYESARIIVWYSEEGHYVQGFLLEDSPWTGNVSFDYVEYQNLFANTLPIGWLDFSATTSSEREVELNWSTATEKDNSHFVIQKGTDGKTFTKIGEQTGKGNNTDTQAYNFTDKTPTTGTNYYRIQQVDQNGKSTFSEVIAAIILDDSETNPTIVLYPNPGKDEVWFSQPAEYELFDVKGQLLTSGKADGVLDVSGLSAGAYFVRINGGEMQSWLKN
jgi:hypothetical protein